MCDERTEVENARYLAQARLHRRELSLGAGAMVATLLGGCKPAPGSATTASPSSGPGTEPAPAAAPPKQDATSAETTSRRVAIDTPEGTADAFFVAPGGRHPGVLVWPDVAGLRPAFETMATRLAAQGYAVLVVNPYYRAAKTPILETFAEWQTEEGRAKIAPMREALTPKAVASDGAAFVAWLDAQPEVDTARRVATTGYCMGGPFTFRTAAAAPERVGVIASFHGGGLVTPDPDSPHLLLPKMKAAALVCIAHNDDERQPEAKVALQRAAESAGLPAEIEVYPAQHGWCVIDSPVYDETEAERAWARMLATFAAHP